MAPTQPAEIQSPAVRAFLRSLNVLLKSARMYGMGHAQTVAQSAEAWQHLQAVLAEEPTHGLQLAVSENRLLVDGVPVKVGPAEQSFTQFLAAADLASVTFHSQITQPAFLGMIRIFAEAGSKPEGLPGKLIEALGDEAQSGIAINAIRFVPAGLQHQETSVAAQLLAQSLGTDSSEVQGVLDDPIKLLQLITVADGASRPAGASDNAAQTPGWEISGAVGGERKGAAAGGSGNGGGAETGGGCGAGGGNSEEETTAAIKLLSRLARESAGKNIDSTKVRQEFSHLPQAGQQMLQQALRELAHVPPKKNLGTPMLLQLAENLAIQFALDRYERGDSRVDAVAEMLNRLNREVSTLRESIGSYEEKLKHSGFEVARPANTLEQEFWGKAPQSAKLEVLLSDQAWRVPTQYIKQCLDQLESEKESNQHQRVLVNYVRCIHNASPEARQKTAAGLKDLADRFTHAGAQALCVALRDVAEELTNEKDGRLQKLITATFVLLGQEAATRRRYSAVLELMSLLDGLEGSYPAVGAGLRERVGLENRVSDFLEEVLHLPEASGDLVEVLRRMSGAAVEHLAGKASRRVRRRERDRLVQLAEQLGQPAVEALRKAFSNRPPAVAVTVVGLLTRLDPVGLEALLPARLHEWNRVYQDAVVRQIASSGAPSRGMLLARILNHLVPLVVPVALDEIGMNGDPAPAPLLFGIAAARLPKFASPFIRVKAIEALGRLRVKEAAPTLQQLLESPELRRDASAKELRIAAAQSLQKIDPQAAKAVLAGAGIRAADLDPIPFDPQEDAPGVRQRYYPRVKLRRALPAKICTADGDFSASVRQLSLGGGLCSCEHRLLPGTPASIRIKTGLRSFAAELFLRDARSEMVAFEIVDMNLEDRSRLRTVLQAARR